MTQYWLPLAPSLLKSYLLPMEKEQSLTKVEERDSFGEGEDLKPKIRRRLLNLAIETYQDVMLTSSKPLERKAAADAVLELLGKKNKDTPQTNTFNFQISPEYFNKVFAEGLTKITEVRAPAIEADFEVIDASGAENGN